MSGMASPPHTLGRILAPVAILALAAGGCSLTQGSNPATAPAGAAEELPIIRQTSGSYSRLVRPVRVVAHDAATLARVAVADVPVDFKTQMVLIVGLGRTPTSQVGVEIVRVWRDGSRIRVQERRIHPGPDQAPGMDPASPWTLAVVPRSDLNVEGFTADPPANLLGEHVGSR